MPHPTEVDCCRISAVDCCIIVPYLIFSHYSLVFTAMAKFVIDYMKLLTWQTDIISCLGAS